MSPHSVACRWFQDQGHPGTILSQERVLALSYRPGHADRLRKVGHWSHVIALHREAPPCPALIDEDCLAAPGHLDP
jgi:hypothetical protein